MKYSKIIPILFAVAFLLSNSLVDFASAKGRGGGSHNSYRSSYSSKSPSGHSRSTYSSAARDSHGKIKRSEKAKHDFQRHNPCPSTGKSTGSCPGYVIDHVTPLKRDGADSPSNMQWQTKEAAKAKDKWE